MISELEDLVQGVADSFLPVLAPPAVVDSSSFLSEEVVQQSVKAPSEWGPLCWPVFAWKDAFLAGFDLRPHSFLVRAHPMPMH